MNFNYEYSTHIFTVVQDNKLITTEETKSDRHKTNHKTSRIGVKADKRDGKRKIALAVSKGKFMTLNV